jgi:type I restriction enzyme S subunit
MTKLIDICDIQYGYAFDSACFTEDDSYLPLVRIRDVKRGFSETFYSGEYPEEYVIHKGDLIVGMDGEFNIARWKSIDALLNQRVCKLKAKEGTNEEYLRFALVKALKTIEDKTAFVTVKHLSAKELNKLELDMPGIEEQNVRAESMAKLEKVISHRKEELSALDNLIKARFVEMFGDPVSNPYGYDKVALSDLADIKIGPFGSLLHKEDYIDGGHPLLNPSHIVDGKVSPDDKLTISDEKYEELSAYQLKAGDVVMGRRGEMGRCAVVPEDGFLCGTGSMLIRTKGEVTADYIQKIISFPSFKKTIEDMAVGQTMPNLNVPIVSGFQIIKPPMEVQDRYYAFAEQVNKSKVTVQKAFE